jgi:hypothetical protein
LAVHAAALTLLLLVLLPIIGTTSQFSADEGAAIAQAVRLERGDGWTTVHPFPAADPDGIAFPLELSVRSGDRYAAFAKHPVYPVMLAAADRIGGRAAMVLLSIAGTVATAVLTALLARRFDPGLMVPALWVTGLASPLFFDGYVVIAHTLAAACAAAAVLCVVRVLEGSGSARWLVGVVVAVLVGMLMRTEMLFLALALSVAVAVVTRGRGVVHWRLVAAPVVGAALGYLLDRALLASVIGGPAATTASVASHPGFLASKLLAFVITWLLPSYSLGAGDALLLGAVVLGGVAARFARTRPTERDGVRLFAVVAAVAAVSRLIFGAGAVPGLLIAFPLLVIGFAAAGRETWSTPLARLHALGFGLFAIAVLATQYGSGGSGEWGGRYFAIGLPLAIPVVLLAITEVARGLDRSTARICGVSLIVVSLALSVLSVVTLRQFHRDTDALVAAVVATAIAHPANDGGEPVVVSSNGAAARLAFAALDQTRWLTVPEDQLDTFGRRLRDLDAGPITFVARNTTDVHKLDAIYRIEAETRPADDWVVAVLQPR